MRPCLDPQGEASGGLAGAASRSFNKPPKRKHNPQSKQPKPKIKPRNILIGHVRRNQRSRSPEYAITCANSVLPMFMHHLGSCKPVSIANRQTEIQIVDTHESLKTRVNIGSAAG